MDKLDRVRAASIVFNKETFGDIFRRKRWIEGRLRGVQQELHRRITSDMAQLEAELQIEYSQVLKQEELLWFQGARGNNVRFGDRNTAYFHTHVVIRNRRNRIHRLKLSNGDWCSDQQVLANEVLSHFQGLFAPTVVHGDTFIYDNFPSVSTAEQDLLLLLVSNEEVKQALMSMRSFSAPGPGGYHPFFHKQYWDLAGEDVCKVVSQAFELATMENKLMETLVALIPKADSPSSVKELRLISLCNVTYKLITKVIVNRILPFMY